MVPQVAARLPQVDENRRQVLSLVLTQCYRLVATDQLIISSSVALVLGSELSCTDAFGLLAAAYALEGQARPDMIQGDLLPKVLRSACHLQGIDTALEILVSSGSACQARAPSARCGPEETTKIFVCRCGGSAMCEIIGARALGNPSHLRMN